jgi:hypothetical protein
MEWSLGLVVASCVMAARHLAQRREQLDIGFNAQAGIHTDQSV